MDKENALLSNSNSSNSSSPEELEHVIWFGYFDPYNSLFKTTQKDRASYSVAYCRNFGTCNAYKKGLCALRGPNRYCPYGKIKREIGPTKKATSSYKFIREAREKYEKEPYIKTLGALGTLCQIGDYAYIPLNYLDNYVNPIQGELGITRGFIKVENFNVDFIKKIYNYRPLALYGGEIKSYQQEEIPNFIIALRSEFPALFGDCLKEIEGLVKYTDGISFVGKRVLIKTLLPGKVRLSSSIICDWDGEKIIGDSSLTIHFLKKEKVYVFPNEDTVCQVVDDATVEWGRTIFID